MDVKDFLPKFANVKETEGGWTAQCPAHDDNRNSLSIGIGDDKRILLFCHGKCATADIVKAVGLTSRDLFPPATKITGTKKTASKIVATYDYHDANGNVVYQAVRYDPKDFRQRKPDGNGGWTWKMDGVDRVPYRLPELLAADASAVVYVPEGEKDVNNLMALGTVATCNVGGAGKWRKEYSEHLRGRHVVILPDNDKVGHEHAEEVAKSLVGIAASIKVVALPGLPDKGDVSDWITAGGTREALEEIVTAAPEWKPSADKPAKESKEKGERGPSQATQLVALAIAAGCEFWHSPDGDAFATLPDSECRATYLVRSKRFRQFASRLFYQQNGAAIGAQALQDAITTLEGAANFDGPEHTVFVRFAGHDGRIYVDLGTPDWQVVEVTASGWNLIQNPPVRFRRAKAMLPLPTPVTGGTIKSLRQFLNVNDEEWPLVPAWLVGAMRPTGPYAVLGLHGEQGAAKSTAARILRSLIDPNSAPLRAEPKEPRDLMIAASNSWAIALDNLSHLSPWLSDCLCRLSTGGGFSTRTLFENDEEQIFDAQRPVILNGIEEVATRSDLIDRSIMVPLPTIPEAKRRSEADLLAEFEIARPGIFGALLTAVSEALKNLPTTTLSVLPRMADFALWATASEPALGIGAGAFGKAYGDNRDDANSLALESSPVMKTVMEVVTEKKFIGTATELLDLVDAKAGYAGDKPKSKPKGWPAGGRIISGLVQRYAPNLRRAGFVVQLDRIGKKRSRIITLERLPEFASASSASSATSFSPEKTPILADAKSEAHRPPDLFASASSSAVEAVADANEPQADAKPRAADDGADSLRPPKSPEFTAENGQADAKDAADAKSPSSSNGTTPGRKRVTI